MEKELNEKKDKLVLKNGSDLMKDEAFWQQAVKDLACETISATKSESGEENVSK